MKISWKCEDCRATGEIEILPNDDAWLLMTKAGEDHDQTAPDCKPHYFARIFPIEYEKRHF